MAAGRRQSVTVFAARCFGCVWSTEQVMEETLSLWTEESPPTPELRGVCPEPLPQERGISASPAGAASGIRIRVRAGKGGSSAAVAAAAGSAVFPPHRQRGEMLLGGWSTCFSGD